MKNIFSKLLITMAFLSKLSVVNAADANETRIPLVVTRNGMQVSSGDLDRLFEDPHFIAGLCRMGEDVARRRLAGKGVPSGLEVQVDTLAVARQSWCQRWCDCFR